MRAAFGLVKSIPEVLIRSRRPSHVCPGPFDPASVPGQLPAGTDEFIDQFVDLAQVLGDCPQVGQRPGQALRDGVEDIGGGLADTDPAFRVRDPGFGLGDGALGGCDRGGLGSVAAVARLPGAHGAGGGQGPPRRLQVAAALPEVLPRAVQRQGSLFLQVLHLAQALADLILGIRQRLEELAVRAVPGAVLPVLLAARGVPGAGAGVQGLQGGGQADDGPRVDASALCAREDPGDGLDEARRLIAGAAASLRDS